MLLLHQKFLSLETHSLSARPFSLIGKRRIRIQTSRFELVGGDGELRKRGTDFNFHSRRAVERESEFEVDPDKAREALRKLDEQLQSLSNKQINRPKIRASDLDRARVQMKEERPKFTESSLAYLAFALLIFTIFYNVLFITVIKPSIDGPEPVAATYVTKAPAAMLLPQLPSMPAV